jgi:hypothetical protein
MQGQRLHLTCTASLGRGENHSDWTTSQLEGNSIRRRIFWSGFTLGQSNTFVFNRSELLVGPMIRVV